MKKSDKQGKEYKNSAITRDRNKQRQFSEIRKLSQIGTRKHETQSNSFSGLAI